MLREAYDIGRIISNNENKSIIDSYNKKSDIRELMSKDSGVLEVLVDYSGEDMYLEDFNFRDIEEDDTEKLLVRKIKQNNHSSAPCFIYTGGAWKSKRYMSMCLSKDYYQSYFKNGSFKEISSSLSKLIENEEDKIDDEIEKEFSNVDSNIIVTVKIDFGEGYKCPGEIDFLREGFKNSVKFNMGEKGNTEPVDSTCYLCNKNKTVFTNAISFGYFTLDNKKFADSFSQEKGWKNCPMCLECSNYVEIGATYLENTSQYLGFKSKYLSSSYKYNIIPVVEEEFEEVDDNLIYNKIINKSINDDIKSFKYIYNEIDLDVDVGISEKPSNLGFSLSLWIYNDQSKGSGSYSIYKKIENIELTHLSKIFKSLENINKDYYSSNSFYNFNLFENVKNLNFDFKSLNNLIFQLFEKNNIKDGFQYNKNSTKDMLLNIFNEILADGSLSSNELDSYFYDEVQRRDSNGVSYDLFIIQSFLFKELLYENNMLDHFEKNISSSEDIADDLFETRNEALEGFFDEFDNFFDSAEKKAIFLEGYLAEKLISAQYHILKSDNRVPFEKKFSNIRLTTDRVGYIFKTISEDLEAYDNKSKNSIKYNDVRSLTSNYLVKAEDDDWGIKDDTAGYYFYLGRSLQEVIDNTIDIDKGDKNE